VAEECFDDLDAPVGRVGSPRILAPHIVEYDRERVPQAAAVVAAARALVRG
jgi:pyruvate/2-oxoglutarate/acetoin dehydrogenase E1 component